jgi:hypothetical protein
MGKLDVRLARPHTNIRVMKCKVAQDIVGK